MPIDREGSALFPASQLRQKFGDDFSYGLREDNLNPEIKDYIKVQIRFNKSASLNAMKDAKGIGITDPKTQQAIKYKPILLQELNKDQAQKKE